MCCPGGLYKSVSCAPPQGLAALAEPSEIAKFIAGWYICTRPVPHLRSALFVADIVPQCKEPRHSFNRRF